MRLGGSPDDPLLIKLLRIRITDALADIYGVIDFKFNVHFAKSNTMLVFNVEVHHRHKNYVYKCILHTNICIIIYE